MQLSGLSILEVYMGLLRNHIATSFGHYTSELVRAPH